MAIPDDYRENFNTLLRAAKEDSLALLEVRERATGQMRYAIVAIGRDGEIFDMTPFALMIDGNPFELFDPPNPDGGFYEDDEKTKLAMKEIN